jgi:hypothetical protein
MVQEGKAINARTGKARKHKTDGKDRESMTEEALYAIGKTGTAAALEKCRVLVDVINAELEKDFANTSRRWPSFKRFLSAPLLSSKKCELQQGH